MKKIKRKDDIKLKTIVTIFLVIFLLTISTGYSYLHAKLKIEGKATIIPQNEQLKQYKQGFSTSSISINPQPIQQDSLFRFYDVKINIVNNDETVNSWVVEMDVPNSYEVSKQKIKCASSVQYENGRLILYSQNWNGNIEKGDILSLEFQVALRGDSELEIKNITFNGLLTQ